MTKIDMSNDNQEIGMILKAIREQQDISLAKVANITKLSITKLVQIETIRYDTFKNDVFSKGQLQLYCSAINYDINKILQPDSDKSFFKDSTIDEKENEKKNRALPISAVLLATGMVALLLILYVSSLNNYATKNSYNNIEPIHMVSPPIAYSRG